MVPHHNSPDYGPKAPTGEDPDGSVNVTSDQQKTVDTATREDADEPRDDEAGEHVITEAGATHYETTLRYKEGMDSLVPKDTEHVCPIGFADTTWSCSCGYEPPDFEAARRHAARFSEAKEDERTS